MTARKPKAVQPPYNAEHPYWIDKRKVEDAEAKAEDYLTLLRARNDEKAALEQLVQSLNERNATSMDNMLTEQSRLSDVIRHLQSDIKELKQQRDIAQANELGYKLDVARLGGMLDAYRDARLIPPISAHETPPPYNINSDPYAWRGR